MYQSCQNISSTVGITKTRAFGVQILSKEVKSLFRNNISRPAGPSLVQVDDKVDEFDTFEPLTSTERL